MSETKENMKGWAFVKTVVDEQEAVMVETMLGMEGIPVQQKHREAGSVMEVYMGISRYGIDLFVPEDALELAKGLLESEVIDMPEETGSSEVLEAAEKYESKKKNIVWIILLYLALPIIALIIMNFASR